MTRMNTLAIFIVALYCPVLVMVDPTVEESWRSVALQVVHPLAAGEMSGSILGLNRAIYKDV